MTQSIGLTVSAGISSNALLSKIAADLNKPNGQFIVEPTASDSMAFMANLPIRKIPGIGRVSERWLSGIGVEKMQDIYRLRGKLYLIVSSYSLSAQCLLAEQDGENRERRLG